jgi:hypothetical protein
MNAALPLVLWLVSPAEQPGLVQAEEHPFTVIYLNNRTGEVDPCG